MVFRKFLAPIVFLLILLATAGCEKKKEELPTFQSVPDFTLIDTSSKPVRFSDTDGRVRILSFFFSSCPHICPKINSRLQGIFNRISDPDLLILSITVDPEKDTSEHLARYASDFRGKDGQQRWKFLTGEIALIEQVMNESLKLASGELPDQHNTRLVLVDRRGVIRGFYQGLDEEAVSRLAVDAKKLLSQ